MDKAHIRNFCIIAHIDHGKSTLADRLLERTGTISPRQMAEQVLDQMDLERERGITIKAKAIRMDYRAPDGQLYELNLIDTPGHVDFTYEVSRSLAACEGAILVVDASQGIQAQTLAHLNAASAHNLTIIPVVNKIDLPNADSEGVTRGLEGLLGFAAEDVIKASAKEGWGTEEVLRAIVERIPPPSGPAAGPLQALIFDSKYDPFKGVVAYVRLTAGSVSSGDRLLLMVSGKEGEAVEVGTFRPQLTSLPRLSVGEVGYIATGLKRVGDCQVGDTITSVERPAARPLPGYRSAKPMVFAGLYPLEVQDYDQLRDALEKLQLNDASLTYERETSVALGFGFRCGFLGLLHLDIVRERLEREFGMQLLITAPSVEYHVLRHDGSMMSVDNPALLPPSNEIEEVQEPWMSIEVITPQRYLGSVMDLAAERKGEFQQMEYLEAGDGFAVSAPQPELGPKAQPNGLGGPTARLGSPKSEASVESAEPLAGVGEARVLLRYLIPLSQLIVDFYDQLKSGTQGYASLDYTFSHYRAAPLVKLEVLVNNQPVDALSLIVPADEAQRRGRQLVQKLRSLIPRQLFDVPVQAAVGSRVVARETVKALRKNVLAKCYGGDVTRKRKLLEKQAEGKKRMKRLGSVDIPQEAFLAVLKLER